MSSESNSLRDALAATSIQRAWKAHRQIVTEKAHRSFRHLLDELSASYKALTTSPHQDAKGEPRVPHADEKLFMTRLNSKSTFLIARNLYSNHISEPTLTPESMQAMRYYFEYSPLVLKWICDVLAIESSSEQNLLSMIWDGTILCRLCITIFPDARCQLLTRGQEYSLHKIVFFLEFCRTVGIKGSALFSIRDLVLGIQADPTYSGVYSVLRTIVKLERLARIKGFQGAKLGLKMDRYHGTDCLSSHTASTHSDSLSVKCNEETPALSNNISLGAIDPRDEADDREFHNVPKKDMDDLDVKVSRYETDVSECHDVPEKGVNGLDVMVAVSVNGDGPGRDKFDHLAAFIDTEVLHVEKLRILLAATTKMQEVSDDEPVFNLKCAINDLIRAHLKFISRIQSDGQDLHDSFEGLLIATERCIFNYKLAANSITHLDNTNMPFERIKGYCETESVQLASLQTMNRIRMLSTFLAI